LIALKRMDYSEADRIITAFTPEYGKLRVLAKGVRKSTSRNAGHLELFAHAHAMLARGRELDLVTQASTIEPFRGVRESLVAASYAYHLGELVDGCLPDRDPHRDVFDLLRGALAALADESIAPQLVARHFELQLLTAIGFRPQLTTCLVCKAPIEPTANGFSVALGGIVCAACMRQEISAAPIATDTLKLLRHLQRLESVRSATIRVPEPVLHDAERVLRRQLEFVLERRLRATEFVRHVAENAASYSA
jgi:DNA repair protein RecO (recombination protein O)